MFRGAAKAADSGVSDDGFLPPREEEFVLFMDNSGFYSSTAAKKDAADFTFADVDAPGEERPPAEVGEEEESEEEEDAVLAALAIAEGDIIQDDDEEAKKQSFENTLRQWELSVNLSSRHGRWIVIQPWLTWK